MKRNLKCVYLISRIKPIVREKIEEFDIKHRNIQYIFGDVQTKFTDFLWSRVLDYVRDQNTPDSQRTLKAMEANQTEFINTWQIATWKVGAKSFSANFRQFMFKVSTLKALIESSKNSQNILSKEINDIKYTLLYLSIEEDALENIIATVQQDLRKNAMINEQIQYVLKVYKKAQDLKATLEAV